MKKQAKNLKSVMLVLAVLIFCLAHIGCSKWKQRTAAEPIKNEAQEKENLKNQEIEKLKIQRAESLKLFSTKLDEFVNLAPPTKLASPPYLKGNAVIVDISERDTNEAFYYGYNFTDDEKKLVYPGKGGFYSEKEIWNKTFAVKSVAEKADDVQTVIQLKFTDTDVCRWYGEVDYTFKKGTFLCGVKAEITVIDNTLPAIIAKKTFTNNKLPKTVEVSDGFADYKFLENEYQMYPFKEIEEYLENLEQK